MFDRDSRYAKLPLKQTTDAQGRPVTYVARRIIREGAGPVAEMGVQPGDRLDLIANRAYGDPRLFWRVADANPVPDHEVLDDTPGRRLKITQIEPE
jgi:hypothetical protein